MTVNSGYHKRCTAVLLFLLMLRGAAYSQTASSNTSEIKPTGLDTAEFPLWAKDLRRGEIVAFGTLPFTIFFATFAVDTYRWASHDWDNRYAPWPIKSTGAINMSRQQLGMTFAIAIGTSAVIAVADHIIVRVKRNKAQREAESLPQGQPIIIRRPLSSGGEDPDGAEAGNGGP
ncbi:hypothetical protein LJC14_00700 [Treponema sp. OttesenSCG-928-L16]|nr:hypothetical protein [Treponema sp. OttesenSCG-928-L16]